MIRAAELYSDAEIVSPVARQLSWTNISEPLTLSDQRKRDFYLAFAAHDPGEGRRVRVGAWGRPVNLKCQSGTPSCRCRARVVRFTGAS